MHRPGMHRRGSGWSILAIGAIGALALVACSADDTADVPSTTDAGSTTSVVTTSMPPATTTLAPPTTDPPSTDPPSTDPPATTEPAATTAPPTTLTPDPDPAALDAEVAAAYDVIYEGYWACLRAPLECDTSWLVPGSGSAEAMQATMQGLADRDRFVGDDPVGYYVIESIELDATLTEATVTTCWWSTAVLYTTPIDPNRPPGPDNPPTVVNDTPGTSRQSDTLVVGPVGWQMRSSQTTESVAEVNRCES